MEIFWMWISVGLTLFMFSFLYKDNPFYKIGEYLYVGVSIGYTMVNLFYESWVPKVWRVIHPEAGVWFENRDWWLLLFPVLLGILVLTRFIPKWAWLSRWTFAFIVGYGSGLAIPATFATSIQKQAAGTIQPLVSRIPHAKAAGEAAQAAEKEADDVAKAKGAGSEEARAARVRAEELRGLANAAIAGWEAVEPAKKKATDAEEAAMKAKEVAVAAEAKGDNEESRALRKASDAAGRRAISTRIAAFDTESRSSYTLLTFFRDFTAIVLFLGVITVLVYFFFSIEHKGPVKHASRLGVLFLMVYFGASYGYTVMGRLSLLYGRLVILKDACFPKYWLATPILLTLMISVLVAMHFTGADKEKEDHA